MILMLTIIQHHAWVFQLENYYFLSVITLSCNIKLPLYVMPPITRTTIKIKTMSFCVILGIWEACHGTKCLISFIICSVLDHCYSNYTVLFEFCIIILIVTLYVTLCRNRKIYLIYPSTILRF